MILQRLVDYFESNIEIPVMYAIAPVKWAIDIDLEGGFKGIILMSGGSGGKKDRGKEMLVPHIVRANRIAAKLLSDNEEYVLGRVSDDPKETPEKRKKREKKVVRRHATFIDLVKECAESTEEAEVIAARKFLEKMNPDELDIPEDLNKKDTITFRVNDTVFPVDLPSVREFWAGRSSKKSKKGKVEEANCIVCGKIRPVLDSHPVLIKGIPGGQTAGMAIISANSNAYESYGLKKSFIAPTCADCAEKYAKALNHLLRSRDCSRNLGGLKYVFWTKEPMGFPCMNFLDSPDSQEVKNLLGSVSSGKSRDTILDEESFYACALSASGGRVVIRDWIETTVGNVKKNLAKWFKLQKLINYDGKEGHPLGLFALAVSMFRESKDIPTNVPRALFSSAIKGLPLPKDLLFKAIKRNHAEQGITRPRAVLIKMVINSNNNYKEDYMEKLETTEKNPAYLCGRLLAELEQIQKSAIHGITSTLTDRFFGTASSAPASVFGKLLRGAQSHLGKLRKDRKGTYNALQRSLEEILSKLSSFPKTLTLEEQGLFSLGYYHQKAHNRAEARRYKLEKSEEKQKVEV